MSLRSHCWPIFDGDNDGHCRQYAYVPLVYGALCTFSVGRFAFWEIAAYLKYQQNKKIFEICTHTDPLCVQKAFGWPFRAAKTLF